MSSTYAVRNYLVACADLVTRLLAPSVSMDFGFTGRDARSLFNSWQWKAIISVLSIVS